MNRKYFNETLQNFIENNSKSTDLCSHYQEYKKNTIKMLDNVYKLHNKNAEKEPYKIKKQYFNIKYLKNIIDVLGTDLIVYLSIDNEYRPLYFENKNGELGLVVPIKKY